MRSRPSLFLAGVVVGAGIVAGGLLLGQAPDAAAPCRPAEEAPGRSVARRWNEAMLEAIRRDLPAPTVHARNLFHVSVAMWDAWAAYEPAARGYVVDEQHAARDLAGAREEAISYAAYRVLAHRYATSVGASDTLPALDGLMADCAFPST